MLLANDYLFDAGLGQVLSVRAHGEQTILALRSVGVGQQQSQQSSFDTGHWVGAPQAWEFGGILYLRIQAQRGSVWLQAGRGQMGRGSSPPSGAIPVPGRSVSAPPPTADESGLPPMPPMRPMQMRMGTMTMQMGGETSHESGDLREENLRLREENLRLREENLRLREQLAAQPPRP